MSTHVRGVMVGLAFVAVALGGCGNKHESRSGEYYNSKDAFSIIPPTGWETRENVMGTAVICLSPMTDPGQTFRENINVFVETIPASMDLDAYLARNAEALAKMATDYKQVSQDRQTVGGLSAGTFVFEHRMGQMSLKCIDYVFVKGGRGYVITCTATPKTYPAFETTFEAACKSFRAE